MTTTIAERTRRIAERAVRATRTEPVAPAVAPSPEQPTHREQVRRELAAYAARLHVTELVREHGSPLFVLDVDRVTTQLLALRRELPGAQIHFATKSLPHPAVIRAVDAFGATFEVASRGEIDLLEREGVAIGRCLHTHPVKTVADITSAYLRGIRTFVVDSASEIGKFAGLPCCDVGVLVRLSFPNPGAKSDLSSKFGVAPEDAPALVERCLAARLPVRGFTFHVGSQTTSPEPWRRAIAATLGLMRALEARHGIRFELLDNNLNPSILNFQSLFASADGRAAAPFEGAAFLRGTAAGNGGNVTIDVQGGQLNGNALQISADGFSGIVTGDTGEGRGGQAIYSQTGGAVTVGDLVVSATGFGGSGASM